MKIGKEGIKLFLFADDMIGYIENSKESIKRCNNWVQQGLKMWEQLKKKFKSLYPSNEHMDPEIKNVNTICSHSKLKTLRHKTNKTYLKL